MDGMSEYTPVELGWIRIWPVEEIVPAQEVVHAEEANRLPDFYVVADHAVGSWYYAIPIPKGSTNSGPMFRVGMNEPEEVAPNFCEFLRMVAEGSSILRD
jgi:hypothetical protein